MTDPTPRLGETSDADITLVREWLTDLDANIDNPYDTQMCDTVRAVLAERDRLAARVAELEAHPWIEVKATPVLCGVQMPASSAKNLGSNPATTCARVSDHAEAAHQDAAGDVMWLDPQRTTDQAGA